MSASARRLSTAPTGRPHPGQLQALTLTQVGRGNVKVHDRRRKRKVTVCAGRGFVVKRPHFLTIKGRPR